MTGDYGEYRATTEGNLRRTFEWGYAEGHNDFAFLQVRRLTLRLGNIAFYHGYRWGVCHARDGLSEVEIAWRLWWVDKKTAPALDDRLPKTRKRP